MLQLEFAKLLQEGAPLNGNQMARHLYGLLENNGFIVSYVPSDDEEMGESEYDWSDILSYPDSETSIPAAPNDSTSIEDHRFIDVLINGFKKIPVKEDYKRLIFTTDKTRPMSAVIMGENGVGKSSFYGALELMGMGEMKTAETYGSEKKEYLRNIHNGESKAKVILNTVSTSLDLDLNDLKQNCPPAFYISEWDIRESERLEDFGSFIFPQLQLESFSNLIELLEDSKRFLDKTVSAKKKIDEKSEKLKEDMVRLKDLLLNNVIPDIEPDDFDLKEFWKKYCGNIKCLLDDILSLNKELANYEQQLESTKEFQIVGSISDLERKSTEIERIITSLKDVFNQRISEWIENILNPIVSGLLSRYLDENEKFILGYEATTRSIYVKLKLTPIGGNRNNGNNPESQPRIYFNTFRFKMFVVSLKIALACCAKAIYKKNWPIVIDDVFSSSDFNNRTQMREFIDNVCEIYYTLRQVEGMEFQLIFFTQDDVIGDAVYQGLKDRKKDVRLMRLYDYRCFDKSEPYEDNNKNIYRNVGVELDYYTFNE